METSWLVGMKENQFSNVSVGFLLASTFVWQNRAHNEALRQVCRYVDEKFKSRNAGSNCNIDFLKNSNTELNTDFILLSQKTISGIKNKRIAPGIIFLLGIL